MAGLSPYRPYERGEHVFEIGLQRLDPAQWIEPDERYAHEMALKDEYLAARHGDVFAAQPGSEPAQREALACLTAFLTERYGDRYTLDGSRITTPGERVVNPEGLAPLDAAGRLVQDDLCLMERRGGAWILAAASLCFPGGWGLHDKIGRPLLDIHGPVPTFAEALHDRVARIFDNLRWDAPVWRANWQVVPTPALFMYRPGIKQSWRAEALDAQTAGEHLWMRVERQTLRRLPETGAILFTIRTYVDPIAEVAADPARRDALLTALRGMAEPNEQYSGIRPFRAPLIGWLERQPGLD
jgi:hypothetical protein